MQNSATSAPTGALRLVEEALNRQGIAGKGVVSAFTDLDRDTVV
jgi:hypothetical protein